MSVLGDDICTTQLVVHGSFSVHTELLSGCYVWWMTTWAGWYKVQLCQLVFKRKLCALIHCYQLLLLFSSSNAATTLQFIIYECQIFILLPIQRPNYLPSLYAAPDIVKDRLFTQSTPQILFLLTLCSGLRVFLARIYISFCSCRRTFNF